jgi:hypothetical protein
MVTADHVQDGILVADQLGEGRGIVVDRLIGASRAHELLRAGIRGESARRYKAVSAASHERRHQTVENQHGHGHHT